MSLSWHKPLKSFCITSPLCNQRLNNLECIRGMGRPGACVSVSIRCYPALCAKVCSNGKWEVCNPYTLAPGCYCLDAKEQKGLRTRCSCMEFCIREAEENAVVTMRYVGATADGEITSPEVFSVKPGSCGKYFSPEIDGCTHAELDPASDFTSGNMSSGDVES